MINHSIMMREGGGIKGFPSQDKFNYSGDIQSVNYSRFLSGDFEPSPKYPSYPKLEIYPEDEVGRGSGAVITPILSKYNSEQYEKSKKWLYAIYHMYSYTKLTGFTINNPGKGYIKPRIKVEYYEYGVKKISYIYPR